MALYNVDIEEDYEKGDYYYAQGVFVISTDEGSIVLMLDGLFNEELEKDEWKIEIDMPDDNNDH